MSLRIALFGQAPLAVDCLDRLLEDGHEIVGVYAPPDTGRPDALATRAEERDLQLFRRQSRGLFAKVSGLPIDLIFLRTDDIPTLCAEGAIDMLLAIVGHLGQTKFEIRNESGATQARFVIELKLAAK